MTISGIVIGGLVVCSILVVLMLLVVDYAIINNTPTSNVDNDISNGIDFKLQQKLNGVWCNNDTIYDQGERSIISVMLHFDVKTHKGKSVASFTFNDIENAQKIIVPCTWKVNNNELIQSSDYSKVTVLLSSEFEKLLIESGENPEAYKLSIKQSYSQTYEESCASPIIKITDDEVIFEDTNHGDLCSYKRVK